MPLGHPEPDPEPKSEPGAETRVRANRKTNLFRNFQYQLSI